MNAVKMIGGYSVEQIREQFKPLLPRDLTYKNIRHAIEGTESDVRELLSLLIERKVLAYTGRRYLLTAVGQSFFGVTFRLPSRSKRAPHRKGRR